MDEATGINVMTQWRKRLTAMRSSRKASYYALFVANASYISANGEYVPRVQVRHWDVWPVIDSFQYPIDTTPYRIAAVSMFFLNTYKGGPPAGWQPPDWTIVHEEQPNSRLKFLGKAETPEPPAEVFDRARAWIAENADREFGGGAKPEVPRGE